MLRTIRLILWAAVGASVVALAGYKLLAPRLDEGIAETLGQGSYRLTATDGTVFTEDTLKGAPSAVFFGFTHCSDVCPTTLGDISIWQDALAEEGKGPLRVYFVTVDPERDTAELLDDYVSWAPGVVGVTGSREEIDAAIRAFRIYAAKIPLDGGGYTMDHSASVLLFDSNGRLFEPIGYQEDFDRVIDKLDRLLAG